MEKEFTVEDMLEFANMHSEYDIEKLHLEAFKASKKQREEEEYKLYLKLRDKYE